METKEIQAILQKQRAYFQSGPHYWWKNVLKVCSD